MRCSVKAPLRRLNGTATSVHQAFTPLWNTSEKDTCCENPKWKRSKGAHYEDRDRREPRRRSAGFAGGCLPATTAVARSPKPGDRGLSHFALGGGVVEDLTKILVREPSRTGIFVELSGEFDVRARRALGKMLGGVVRWGRPVYVDLSGVTFLDASCLWELAVHYQLHGDHLVLSNPSWQVELSVAACNLEGWISFHSNKGSASRATTCESSTTPREGRNDAAGRAGGRRSLDRHRARKPWAPGSRF